MRRFIPRSLVTAAILAAATACGHAVPAPPPIPFYEPDVALRDVRLRGVGLFGGTLDLWMRVYNPNTYDIMSPRVGYEVMVDRVHVASGFADLNVVVPARDSVEVRVPAEFRYSDLGPAGRAIVGRGAAMYRVMGRVSVGTPYGRRSFPYDRAGQYGMVDAPLGPPRRDDGGYGRDPHDAHEREAYDRSGPDTHEQHASNRGGSDEHEHESRGRDGRDHDGQDPERGGRREHSPEPVAAPAPPRRDTPRGPDGHQPVAHEPGQHEVHPGHPGEGRQPGPVPPRQAPGGVEHPPAQTPPVQPAPPAHPVHPVHPVHPAHPVHPDQPAHPAQPAPPAPRGRGAPRGGASTPPSHDSSAHQARRGGKPCPPPEPQSRGESGNAHQQDRRVPPPCVLPDTGGEKGKHRGPAHTQR